MKLSPLIQFNVLSSDGTMLELAIRSDMIRTIYAEDDLVKMDIIEPDDGLTTLILITDGTVETISNYIYYTEREFLFGR